MMNYDPELHGLLWGKRRGKRVIIYGLIDNLESVYKFEITPNESSVFNIEFAELVSDDFKTEIDSWFEIVNDVYTNPIYKSDIIFGLNKNEQHIERYKLKILFSKLQNSITPAKISDYDLEGLAKVKKYLETSSVLMSSTQQTLSEFIRNNFVIENLLEDF